MIATTSTERPMLFSGPMVRAILAGTKTQTRRAVDEQRNEGWRVVRVLRDPTDYRTGARLPSRLAWEWRTRHGSYAGDVTVRHHPGDTLWVRETWRETRDGYAYAADESVAPPAPPRSTKRGAKGWRPSLHMPRAAARLFLKVTDVKVERVQEISAADAIAEGIECIDGADGDEWRDYRDAPAGAAPFADPVRSYATLWDLVAPRDRKWASNPWVVAITFRRTQG